MTEWSGNDSSLRHPRSSPVIPANAGIHFGLVVLGWGGLKVKVDSRVRGNDGEGRE